MQITINIFTVIGSFLGIIAFIISIVNPIQIYNARKWTKLNSVLSLRDLEELCDGVSYGVVFKEPNYKLQTLVNLIDKDFEEIHFKGNTGRRINKKLKKITEAADNFYKEVQVPIWDFVRDNPDNLDKMLNKEYIYKKSSTIPKGEEKVNKSLETATSEIEKIIELYRSIYKMSTKLPVEYLYKK